jgi:hypothetical protein
VHGLVIVFGLIAAASTLDPVLITPACGCEGEWFRPAEGALFLPALAMALVATIRRTLARTPLPSCLPVAVAGRNGRLQRHLLRVRCATSPPLRWLIGIVNVMAAIVVALMLVVSILGELGDHAPLVVSHVLLIVVAIACAMLSRRAKVP